MQSHLLEEASKVITNPQILINVISRRVRQLVQGHRPLVELGSARVGFCDTALMEVIRGKLSYEMVAAIVPDATMPRIIEPAVFVPKSK